MELNTGDTGGPQDDGEGDPQATASGLAGSSQQSRGVRQGQQRWPGSRSMLRAGTGASSSIRINNDAQKTEQMAAAAVSNSKGGNIVILYNTTGQLCHSDVNSEDWLH